MQIVEIFHPAVVTAQREDFPKSVVEKAPLQRMDEEMKTIPSSTCMFAVVGLAVLVASATSCMTSYDANGNPVQSVDPGLAVAGAAAAGVLGYAISNNRNDNNYYYNNGGGYYAPRGPYYYGGGGYNRYHGGGGYRGGAAYRGGRRYR